MNISSLYWSPIKTFAVGILVCAFFSCDGIKSEFKFELPEKKIELTERTMFDYKLVKKVVRASNEEQKKVSREIFLEGLKIYKKQHRKFRSMEYFKNSILAYPNPKYYYEYGSVALELKLFPQAQKALHLAEQLNFKHRAKLYYKLSELYSIQKDLSKSGEYLKLAFENGYSDIKRITVDSSLNNLKDTEQYREIVADHIPNDFKRREALFELFVQGFAEEKLPFVLDYNQAGEFNYENYIPYDYAELLRNQMGTDDTREFSYVGKVYQNEKFIALVYAAIEVAPEAPSIVEKYLVTFDYKGNLIDKNLLACSCSAEVTVSGKIDQNKEIKLSEYKNVWKYDLGSTDFSSNEIDTVLIQGSYYFKLTEEGLIQELDKKDEGKMARL